LHYRTGSQPFAPPGIIGREVIYYPCVSSTMDVAAREARRGAPEGTVIIAGAQTAGRGRQGRSWLSLPGNLFLTVVLRPSPEWLPQLIMLASVGTARTLERLGLRPGIKWPNDVLVAERKICGILTEAALRGGEVDYALVGIGMNVALDPGRFPEIAATATSLASLGVRISLSRLARLLLGELDHHYLKMRAGESPFPLWRSYLTVLGRKVIITGGTEEQGTAEDVAPDGSLLLRRDDGRIVRITVGDVSLRTR